MFSRCLLRVTHRTTAPLRLLCLALVLLVLMGAAAALTSAGTAAFPTAPAWPAPNGTPAVDATPGATPAASPGASPVAGTSAQPIPSDGTAGSATAGPDDGVTTTTRQRRTTSPSRGVDLEKRKVYDPYRLLEHDERQDLELGATRLGNAGLPTVIYVRVSEATREQAQTYANRILNDWKVESAPGAGDGMVILINLRLRAPKTAIATFAIGPHALPNHGLDYETLTNIYRDEMHPPLKKGEVYQGLMQGVRRFVYYVTFFPDPQQPLSTPRRELGHWLDRLSPALTMFLIATFGVAWVLTQLTQTPRRQRLARLASRAALIGALAAIPILAVLSVIGRSRVGVSMLVVLLAVLGIHWFVVRTSPDRRRQVARRVRAGLSTASSRMIDRPHTARRARP